MVHDDIVCNTAISVILSNENATNVFFFSSSHYIRPVWFPIWKVDALAHTHHTHKVSELAVIICAIRMRWWFRDKAIKVDKFPVLNNNKHMKQTSNNNNDEWHKPSDDDATSHFHFAIARERKRKKSSTIQTITAIFPPRVLIIEVRSW